MRKKISWLLIAVLVLIGFYIIFNEKKDINSLTEATFSKSELGLKFNYPTGPLGYKLSEVYPSPEKPTLVQTIILQRTEDAERGLPEAGEHPPVISVNVYKNTKKEQPKTWAQANTSLSNINLIVGTTQDGIIGKENATHYKADGLYMSSNAVVANGEFIYVFRGEYLDPASEILKDYWTILATVKFLPIRN